MWWNMYHMLAKRTAPQTVDSFRPDHDGLSSGSIDAMVQQISSDIARMTEAERELVKANLAHHAREWCLRDISHDLRTPLNAIIGFTQMMESGMFGPVGNPQYLEYLRHIRESGYELLEKVEDLIDTVAPSPVTRRPARPARKQVRPAPATVFGDALATA